MGIGGMGGGGVSHDLATWIQHINDDGKTEARLRAASDAMDSMRLHTAIVDAEANGFDGPPLRTAKFILQHITEAHHTNKPSEEQPAGLQVKGDAPVEKGITVPAKAVPTITPPAHPAGGITIDQTKPPPTPAAPVVAGPPPKSLTPLVPDSSTPVKSALVGPPKNFDWWSKPASSLAPLLPDADRASRFDALGESDSVSQARHDAIVALAEPRFRPINFPIGVVAYNRPELLKSSLDSLLRVRGIDKSQITVYQDGTDAAVHRVARDFGITIRQHLNNRNEIGQEGAAQIARHYKWTFTSIFDQHPNAQYAIVVEDDMLFADDFLLYFTQLAPLYELDPSIYCITSWNDNGQSGLALDPRVLLRTDFFIGLGWMISRQIYKNEFESIWPRTHWDHWLRDPQQRKNRQCVFPEVPRNYNIGKRGTHSDDNMYAQYFERIVLNAQPAVWLGDITRVIHQRYESMTLTRVRDAIQISTITDVDKYSFQDLALFLELTGPDDKRWENHYAPYFGLWHSIPYIRGWYNRGFLYLRWHTNYLLLVTSNSPTYTKFRLPSTRTLDSQQFLMPIENIRIIKARPAGETCNEACARESTDDKKLVCTQAAMARINLCEIMQVDTTIDHTTQTHAAPPTSICNPASLTAVSLLLLSLVSCRLV